ncbi:MAG TPA: AraC family transcriptional regulator ligand-binding domain-containing protein, partial [Dongiaceae bacterium]|nr:AraC family transcriptional regulator ligand-binding domain-containing protein [Dongiaceae bacterium]
MTKRAILGFIYTLQALRDQGADLSGLKQKYGIDLDHLSPDGDIDRSLELRIYADLLPTVPDELAGLKIGTMMSLAGYGPLIMLLLTCRNVWEAFQAGIRYQALTYLFGELRLDVGEKESRLCIRPSVLPSSCRRFLIDRDISGTYQLMRDLQNSVGLQLQPLRIYLPYPKPRDIRAYEERFQCPVEFGSAEACAPMPSEFLGLPFPAANKTAHALYQKQCDSLLLQRSHASDQLSQQVHDYLRLFSETFPAVQEVAATFGLPERSFRRRLNEENTSFRKLLDQVRFDKARQLLQ